MSIYIAHRRKNASNALDADKVMNLQHLVAIWQTSGSESGLIQKSGFQ